MITVLNFSHPLNPEAAAEIKTRYGAGEAALCTIPVQVDLTQPLMPQIERIFQEALRAVRDVYGAEGAGSPLNVDCLILPGLSAVAVPLANRFPTANLIVMASNGSTPPKFMPVELLRSRQWRG
jgi:hypothetical protein